MVGQTLLSQVRASKAVGRLVIDLRERSSAMKAEWQREKQAIAKLA